MRNAFSHSYRPDLIGCAWSPTCGDESVHGPRGLCQFCRAPTAEETAALERELARAEALGKAFFGDKWGAAFADDDKV